MTCPYCETEMEHGYIQSCRGIFWSSTKRTFFFAARKKNGDAVIAPYDPFIGSTAEAYLCRRCRKIIADWNVN